MLDFFKIIILFLTNNNIEYMLSGSVALSVYSLSRATKDFDFVVNIKEQDADKFVQRFSGGFYCDKDSIKDAIQHKSMFNIIHHQSGFKADFIILKNQPFQQREFERRCEVEFLDMNVYVVSAEDLLISKLIWIQSFQSGVQMEDIKALKEIENLDLNYVRSWIERLKLKTFNLI